MLQCIGLCYSICGSEHTQRRRTNARVKVFELPACEKPLTKPRGAGARDGLPSRLGALEGKERLRRWACELQQVGAMGAALSSATPVYLPFFPGTWSIAAT